MRDPRINFRTPELAAVLAFLVPGAGHYYQGRRLKAGIYFSGIVSLFFAGMILGNWQPVYSQTAMSLSVDPVEMASTNKTTTKFSISYGAQFFNGINAIPALIQQLRFKSSEQGLQGFAENLDSDFVGVFRDGRRFVPVSGAIQLSPAGGSSAKGEFRGVTDSGESVTAELSGTVQLGRDIYGSPRRRIIVNGLLGPPIGDLSPTSLVGSVERPFVNWYQAPRDTGELDRLHGRLSHRFDIACVFTWIAGLLNLMAIWDAYGGPAYGYGDEEPEDDDESAGDE